MRNLKLILFVFLSYSSIAQIDSSKFSPSKFQQYIKFLTMDSLKGGNSMLIPSYNFMYTNCGAITHAGRGTYVGLGLNVARLFSKKFVLGIGIELKAWKGLWSDNLKSDFVNDFNAGFQNNLIDINDSARAQTLKDCFNGSQGLTRRGTFYANYTLFFSPFPQTYGGFMLIVKYGGFGIPINGTYGKIFNPGGADWVSFSIPGKFCFELACKPLNFKKKHNVPAPTLACSIFYQRLNWKEANFDGLKWNTFMSEDFINKYAIQDHFGFTLKFTYY